MCLCVCEVVSEEQEEDGRGRKVEEALRIAVDAIWHHSGAMSGSICIRRKASLHAGGVMFYFPSLYGFNCFQVASRRTCNFKHTELRPLLHKNGSLCTEQPGMFVVIMFCNFFVKEEVCGFNVFGSLHE